MSDESGLCTPADAREWLLPRRHAAARMIANQDSAGQGEENATYTLSRDRALVSRAALRRCRKDEIEMFTPDNQ
jgi:hypothetical protein